MVDLDGVVVGVKHVYGSEFTFSCSIRLVYHGYDIVAYEWA
jgi:hypothetical protein